MLIRHPHSARGNDLYETPEVATLALLRAEPLPRTIWEPACGPGAIVRVLRDAGHRVVATDLINYRSPDQDHAGRDFLLEPMAPDGVEMIVTNPPGKLAAQFATHALSLCPRVAIVDETRAIERVPTWADPVAYARCVARSYRRDFWDQQPVRVEVWSEKGTVRGVLGPVLDHYAVGFRVLHRFSGATTIHDVAQDDDGRELIVLYVGDFDPSGMFMSEVDLPARLSRYDGDHVELKRIALTSAHGHGLTSFPATDKRKDPRYKWFRSNYGDCCWELDAMDPNDLRDCVEQEIRRLIEPIAWQRCEVVNKAEQESLQPVLEQWGVVP